MVAFVSLSSRPSYEILCSAGEMPDLSQGKERRELGAVQCRETPYFGLQQRHHVLKLHLRIDLDAVGRPQIRQESYPHG